MQTAQAQRSSAFAYYGRLALYTGVPFGLAMGAWIGFRRGIDLGLAEGLMRGLGAAVLGGVFFGVTMSAILGTLARVRTKHMGPGALGVNQRRTVEVEGTRGEVLARVVAVLGGLPRARASDVEQTDGEARVELGKNWKSWGEVVSARVEEVAPNRCRVSVESRPKLETTIVDYGVGTENVEAFVAQLTS